MVVVESSPWTATRPPRRAVPCRGAEGTWIDATTTHPDIRSDSTLGACARENNPGLAGWLRFAVGVWVVLANLCGTRTRTAGGAPAVMELCAL